MKWTKIEDGKLNTLKCLKALRKIRDVSWQQYRYNQYKLNENNIIAIWGYYDGTGERITIYSINQNNFYLNVEIKPYSISEIQSFARYCYTYDYGEIFLNPWDDSVLLVGSKKGIGYTPNNLEPYNPNVPFDQLFFDVPDIENITRHVKSSDLLIETYPEIPTDENMPMYLHVAQMCNINSLNLLL